MTHSRLDPASTQNRGGNAESSTSPASVEAAGSLFATDRLLHNLRDRSIRAGLVTVSAQAFRFFLQMASTMVLARLLTPADFGLLAMVMPVVGFSQVFGDAGLSMATVQKSEVNHQQVSTLFWLNAALGALLACLMFAAAPLVAWFYGEPSLVGVTAALGLPLLLTGVSIQHDALLIRQMRFTRKAAIAIAAQVSSIAIGILSAARGAQYWSLVYMTLTNTAVTALLTWLSVPWLPARPGRWSDVRPMLAFGGALTGCNFVTYLVRNIDHVLIGWACGKIELGFYSKAYSLLLLPITQVNGPIGSVAVPALSRLQEDPVRFRSYYRKGIYLLAMVGMPIVGLCSVATRDVVLLMLGPQWEPTVPVFRALIPAAFLGTFNVAAGWVFVPLGMAGRQLRIVTVNALIILIAFGIGLRWGALGMAVSFSVSAVVIQIPTLFYAYARSPVGFRDLWWALWPPASACGAAAFLTALLDQAWAEQELLARLLWSGLAFTSAYLAVSYVLSRGSSRSLRAVLFSPRGP